MKIIERIKNRLTYIKRLKLDKPIIDIENKESYKFLLDSNNIFSSEIEESIKKSKISDNKYINWALMPSSIRYFASYILNNTNNKIRIIELGGGRSTFFWDNLIDLTKNKNLNLKIETYEHDESWAKELNNNLKNISINFKNLKQISDNEFELLFKDITYINNWNNIGKIISSDQNRETRIKNCFYNINYDDSNIIEDIDGIIVDGPHGNGRSIAFPIFYKNLKNNSFILIDDYTHYPFIDDMSKLYNFEVLAQSKTNLKKWILIKVINKKLII